MKSTLTAALMAIMSGIGSLPMRGTGTQGNRYTPNVRTPTEVEAWNKQVEIEKLRKHHAKLARRATKW